MRAAYELGPGADRAGTLRTATPAAGYPHR
jgi:hypothetical protein